MSNLEILHYGVKGMRWGERKVAVKQAAANVTNYRSGIAKRYQSKVGTNGISKSEYSKLDSKDVVVAKAGTQVKRVAGTANNQLANKTYVSTNAKDHNRYVSTLAINGNEKVKYDLSITLDKALVSPSKKVRIDTFIETLNDQVPAWNQPSTVRGRSYFEDTPEAVAMSTKDLGLKTYNRFAQSQIVNTPLHTAYFKKIQDKGYTALIDDADKGLVSDMPVILFSQVAGARVTSVRKLSGDDILDAQLNLEDL